MGDVRSVISRIVGSGKNQTHCVLLEYVNGSIGLIDNSSRRSWVYPTETIELTGENGWDSIDNRTMRLCEAILDSKGEVIYLDDNG